MKKRVQYDLDYIRRWSLWLDCKIIVLTAVRVLGQGRTDPWPQFPMRPCRCALPRTREPRTGNAIC